MWLPEVLNKEVSSSNLILWVTDWLLSICSYSSVYFFFKNIINESSRIIWCQECSDIFASDLLELILFFIGFTLTISGVNFAIRKCRNLCSPH